MVSRGARRVEAMARTDGVVRLKARELTTRGIARANMAAAEIEASTSIRKRERGFKEEFSRHRQPSL